MGIPTRTDCLNLFWLGRYTTRTLGTLTLGLEVLRCLARGFPWPKAYEGVLGRLPLAQEALPWFLDTVVRQEEPPGVGFALKMAREDAICLRGLLGTKAVTLVNLAGQEAMAIQESNVLQAPQRILAFGNALLVHTKERLGAEWAWMFELGGVVEALDLRLSVLDMEGALHAASRLNGLFQENGLAIAPLEQLTLPSLEEKVHAFERMLSV